MDKDRLTIEYDRASLELKRTKIELAMSEERKTESEQCYKNEIKYLIEKLLKMKNKLMKARELMPIDDSESDQEESDYGTKHSISFTTTKTGGMIVNQRSRAQMLQTSMSSSKLNTGSSSQMSQYLKQTISKH